MFNLSYKKGSNSVALDSLEIDAELLEDNYQSSTLKYPLDKVVKGIPVQNFSHSTKSITFNEPDKYLESELDLFKSYSSKYGDSAVYHNRLSYFYNINNKFEEAERHAKAAIDIDDNFEFQYRLALSYIDNGNLSLAKEIFLYLADNDHVDSALRLAELYLHENLKDKADKLVFKYLSIHKSDWRLSMLAGTLSLYDSAFENAIRYYRTALENRPNSSVIYKNMAIAYSFLHLPDKSMNYAKKALGIDPFNRDALSLYVDFSIFTKKHFDYSKTLLKNYLIYKNEDRKLIDRLSYLYYLDKEYKNGTNLLSNIASKLDSTNIWNYLGVFWKHRDDRDKAIKCYRMALQLIDDDKNIINDEGAKAAFVNLVGELLETEKFSLAKQLLDSIVNDLDESEYYGDSILCLVPRLYAHTLGSQNKARKAIEFATEAIQSSYINNLGKIELLYLIVSYHCYSTGDYDEAQKLGEECYKISLSDDIDDEHRESAINNLAYVYIVKDLLDEANILVEKLQFTYSQKEYSYATKGLYFLRKNNLEKGSYYYDKSITLCNKISKKNAFKQTFNLELAKYYIRKNDYLKAKSHLNKVIKLGKPKDLWEVVIPTKEAKSLLRSIK